MLIVFEKKKKYNAFPMMMMQFAVQNENGVRVTVQTSILVLFKITICRFTNVQILLQLFTLMIIFLLLI